MRSTVGLVLGVLGVICALVGLFLINGISIEFPGIVLGASATFSVCRAGAGVEAVRARFWA